jgi:deazaflavin-dependent oxidoreductase (nitroreductase family)
VRQRRSLAQLDPARPPLRWLLRAPLALYRARLGWLLGGRFAELTVRGRKSGLPRKAVLEVLERERQTGAVLIASAWGERSEWFRNLAAHPLARVRSGFRSFEADARVLDERAAAAALGRYVEQHRLAYRWFIGPLLLGTRATGSAAEVAAAARTIRILSLTPAR